MNRLSRLAVTAAVALCLLATPSLFAKDGPKAKVITSPSKDSVYFALMEGLRVIDEGHFGEWMRDWCSQEKLCFNDTTRRSIEKYNLPAMKRLAPHCLKGKRNTLHVTRVDGDPEKDSQVKIFVECKEGGMPRPFRMVKEKKAWRFEKI